MQINIFCTEKRKFKASQLTLWPLCAVMYMWKLALTLLLLHPPFRAFKHPFFSCLDFNRWFLPEKKKKSAFGSSPVFKGRPHLFPVSHSLAGVTFVDSIVSGREQKRRFVVTPHGGRAVGEGRKVCMSSTHQKWPLHTDQVSNCAIREQA